MAVFGIGRLLMQCIERTLKRRDERRSLDADVVRVIWPFYSLENFFSFDGSRPLLPSFFNGMMCAQSFHSFIQENLENFNLISVF